MPDWWHCMECGTPIPSDAKGTIEVWTDGQDQDEPPLHFCWPGCAGSFLTDMSLA